ncbi:acrylyl-CoA reductase family protein [Salirhabdus salicampi]|uniref:acrylyl-CoA reductase family protein n=1 Tax=Salirhabdus salicampi TaxID=476102 RepID=UPI0020C58D7B|nr:acryloyl-CoA reductase [Salirhabdus salicampi]MCP8617136.1 acryloyl-CoA reductase [Salirhabdus salicampi]
MKEKFSALVVDKRGDTCNVGVRQLTLSQLPKGEVTVKVAYSSVNYKDGLASIPNGKIVQSYPFVPGIDLAGIVVASESKRFKEGDEVLVTGYELGVSHYGGYSEYARVKEEWVVPLPEQLSMKEAMAYGTAGFTAALSIYKLEKAGLSHDQGPVLVTGATGGVGSIAAALLANKGYQVVASTGSNQYTDYLKGLGVSEVIGRNELEKDKIRALDKQRWIAAVDPVGGKSLAYILSSIQYGGSVAVSGLVGGVNVPTTVFPFILRGVNLLGVDSVYCPMEVREELWRKMAAFKPQSLMTDVSKEVSLQELPTALSEILEGKTKGRVIVKVS